MFKKTFFVSTAALLLCFLASCSFINTSDTSASVSLNLARSVSGHVEYDYIDVFLQGDSTQTKRISADESTVTFDELPNGASVYIKADAYQNGELIYTGKSETIKVNSGENPVSLTLKRIYSVKFKLNFDDEGIYAEQRIISGEYAKQPEDPAKVEEATSSFKFEGWFELNSQEAFDFENTPIKKDLVLYARWAEPETKYYTVSFNTNGGKGSFEDQTVIEGNKASKPEVEPTRETDDEAGYEFAGWFISEDNGKTLSEEPFDFNTPITSDITLYAGWKVTPYVTVTFNVNGGKGDYEAQRVLKGTTISKPATNPTKDSDGEHTYNFLNWYASTDGGKTFVSSPFDFTQPVTADTELYAVWTTEEIYTVTFNLNGGNGTNFEQNVIANEKINPPASNPERAADEVYEYSFAGWYTSEDDGKTLSTSPFDFENTPVTRNLVLYAGWTKTEIIYYYVYFNTLQSGSMIEDQRVVQGGYAKEPSTMPVRPDQEKVKYIFDGWYISTDSGITFADKPFDFKNTPITNTITLFAKWTEVHYYYVDFNTLEGGGAIESQLIIEGGYAEKPSTTPIRTNDDTHTYTFDGWFTSTDKGQTFADTSFDFANTPITSDITLYAKWTVTEYFYVSFNTMGGNGTFINQKIQKGETATEPGVGPTKTSTSEYIYTFAGWYTSDDGGETLSSTPYNFATPVTKAITLYAKWISKKYCHVTFDVNGGDGTFKEQTIIEGNKASKPEDIPTKETDSEAGYEFAGWFTSSDGGKTLSTEAFDFNTAITDDLTLYAGWTLIPYVTVTFNVNGGTGEYEAQRILKGKTITKPENNPKKETDAEHTYSFLNWSTSPDGEDNPFDFSQPITGDIELYAVWTTKGIYTVTFNLNGGKGSNTEENVIAGEKVSAPSKAPEKETDEDFEYTFAGWFTSDDNGKTLSTTPFDFDTAITNNITLYAGWNTTPFYTVTFINRDGNETFQAQRILSGKTASRPETDPTRESTESFDYTFIGWFISEDGGTTLSTTQFDFDTAITGDITLCAAWSVTIFHKVYFYTNGANQSIEPQRIQDGLPVSEPTTSLTKDSTESESYEFDGWYTSEDGGNTLSSTPYNFDTPITKNLALYAKWKVSVSSPFEVEIPLDEIKDISVSIAENAEKGTWTFTAETGYDTYKWKWDGETQTSTSNIFETPEDAVPGKYQISLLATKVVDGKTEYYSFSERIEIK